MSTFTRLSNGKVIFDNGSGEKSGFNPDLNVLRHPSDDKLIVISPYASAQQHNDEGFSFNWEGVTDPSGSSSRDDLIEELSTNFFFKASGGGGGLISGTVANYAALPTPASSYTGEVWRVTSGSVGYLTWLGVYKYSKGLYSPNPSNVWELVPFNVKITEDSLTLVNIDDWGEWISYAFDIHAGDRLIFDGIIYTNLTGTQTSTTPNLDFTNWQSEYSIGTPISGKSVAFGEGGSYWNGMLVYFWNDNTSVWVNMTSDYTNPLTDVILPNNTDDSALYFASTLNDGVDVIKHYGIEYACAIAATLGGGNFIYEYWNGSTWEEIHHMTKELAHPHQSYADTIFEDANDMDVTLDYMIVNSDDSDWAKNDPMTLGTSYFWTRIRIESTITTAPTLSYFKLHSNSVKITEKGASLLTGAARGVKNLNDGKIDFGVWTNSPSNKNLQYLNSTDGENYDIGKAGAHNDFSDSAPIDKIPISFLPEADMDTSCPVIFDMLFAHDDDSGGNIRWLTSKGISGKGDGAAFFSTGVPTTIRDYGITTNLHSISADTEYVLWHLRFMVYFSKAIAQKLADGSFDQLNLVWIRNATGGEGDTFSDPITLSSLRVLYFRNQKAGGVK